MGQDDLFGAGQLLVVGLDARFFGILYHFFQHGVGDGEFFQKFLETLFAQSLLVVVDVAQGVLAENVLGVEFEQKLAVHARVARHEDVRHDAAAAVHGPAAVGLEAQLGIEFDAVGAEIFAVVEALAEVFVVIFALAHLVGLLDAAAAGRVIA